MDVHFVRHRIECNPTLSAIEDLLLARFDGMAEGITEVTDLFHEVLDPSAAGVPFTADGWKEEPAFIAARCGYLCGHLLLLLQTRSINDRL